MSKLQIKLLEEKPYKKYSVNVSLDYHIEELYKFLRNHKDKQLDIIINGQQVKFNSIASRKKFAEGFQRAGKLLFDHTKTFAKNSQDSINKLTNDLTQANKEISRLKEEREQFETIIRSHKVVSKLRALAWQDSLDEYKYACEVLKNRLDKIEPIINIVRNAKADGDLNKAHIKVKKENL